MSLSKPTSKKRRSTEAAFRKSSKKLRSEEEEEASWDFSQWAWQDTKKAPLAAASSSDAPMARWLGVQSLASIITGKDGKVFVNNATSKHDFKFEKGYVEGYQKQTHVVMPPDAPRAVADLFSSAVAKKVLKTPSFLKKLEDAGGDTTLLRLQIEVVQAELNVYTPEEYESLVSFCKTCGGTEEGKIPLRLARVQGELVMALIDVVMLAKKCTYETAKKICQDLLIDYWQFDMENEIYLRGENSPNIFHFVQLGAGQVTLCVGSACLAEVLILIPGCELSTQLRKDMVRSFFGVGGSQVTFESLLANPRIQVHLRGCSENPVVEILQDREHKELMQGIPGILQKRDEGLQLALKTRDEELQLALQKRDEGLQLALQQRDEALKKRDEDLQLALKQRDEDLQLALKQRDEALAVQFSAFEQSIVSVISSKFTGMILSLATHINSTVTAAVAAGLGLKKAQPKKSTKNSTEMPEDQRAIALQTGPLSLALSTVAIEVFPSMRFAVWKKIRGSFGHHAKSERLRRHHLGEQHPEYVAMPLLWAYAGGAGSVEGGGARYVYIQDQRSLLKRVFQQQIPTSHAQRRAGAPCPTESLEQRAHRLTARLSAAERAMEWPTHTSELEPLWNEETED